jgi:hypothetical protein
MSEHRILSFKPALRLEWRGQNPQSKRSSPIIPSAYIRRFLHLINADKVSVHTQGPRRRSLGRFAARAERTLASHPYAYVSKLSRQAGYKCRGRKDPSNYRASPLASQCVS